MSGLEILAAAAAATSAVATGVSAYGQAQAASSNAKLAEAQGAQDRADAQIEANRRRRVNDKKLKQAAVALGSGGFLAPGDLLADMAAEMELEAFAVETDGERRRRFSQNQATQFRNDAKGAMIGGGLKAASTLMGAAYEQWGRMPQPGG